VREAQSFKPGHIHTWIKNFKPGFKTLNTWAQNVLPGDNPGHITSYLGMKFLPGQKTSYQVTILGTKLHTWANDSYLGIKFLTCAQNFLPVHKTSRLVTIPGAKLFTWVPSPTRSQRHYMLFEMTGHLRKML
jgi:hypothetical protein